MARHLSMVAAASKQISHNPFRPVQKPYEIWTNLRPELSWMLPDDGLSVQERIKTYREKGLLQVTPHLSRKEQVAV